MSEFRFYLFKRTKLSSVLKKKKWRNHVVTGCLKKENETLPPKPPQTPRNAESRPQRSEVRTPLSGAGPRDLHFFTIPGGSDTRPGMGPVAVTTEGGRGLAGTANRRFPGTVFADVLGSGRPRATPLPLCGPNPRTPTLRLRCTGEGTGARLAGSTGSSRRPVRPLTSRPPPSLERPCPSRPPPSITFSPRSRRGRLAAHVCFVRLYNYLPPNEVINSLRAGTTSSLTQQRWKDT